MKRRKKKRNFDVDTYLKAAVNWWNNLLWWKAWNAAAPFNFHAAVLTQVKPSCLFQQPGRLTIFPYFFSSRLLWLERKEALFFVFSTIDSRQSRKPAVKQFFFIINIIFFFLLLLLFSIFLFLTFWCNAVVVVNHSLVTKINQSGRTLDSGGGSAGFVPFPLVTLFRIVLQFPGNHSYNNVDEREGRTNLCFLLHVIHEAVRWFVFFLGWLRWIDGLKAVRIILRCYACLGVMGGSPENERIERRTRWLLINLGDTQIVNCPERSYRITRLF